MRSSTPSEEATACAQAPNSLRSLVVPSKPVLNLNECNVSKTAVVELLRVAWRTVGAIVALVSADIDVRVDRLAGLRRIGIDEI